MPVLWVLAAITPEGGACAHWGAPGEGARTSLSVNSRINSAGYISSRKLPDKTGLQPRVYATNGLICGRYAYSLQSPCRTIVMRRRIRRVQGQAGKAAGKIPERGG